MKRRPTCRLPCGGMPNSPALRGGLIEAHVSTPRAPESTSNSPALRGGLIEA